jgi:hypothetical protein
MPTVEEYSRQPAEVSLARLRRAADEIGAAIRGRSEAELVRRPSPSSWAPVEIVCHLRDVEELFQQRFHMIIAFEEPEILAFSARPEDLVRWRIGGPIGHPLTRTDGPRSASTCGRTPRLPSRPFGAAAAKCWRSWTDCRRPSGGAWVSTRRGAA